MAMKFALIALIAFFSVQGLAEAKYAPAERGAIDQFQKIAQELQKVVSEAVSSGLVKIQEAIDKAIINATNELEAALQEIKALVNEMMKEIADLETEAQKLRGDAKECVEAQQENIAALVSKTREQLVDCTKDAVEGITEIYAEYEKIMIEANDAVLALLDEFEACENLQCKGETILKILEVVSDMNSKSRELIAEAMRLIQNSAPEVGKCVLPVVQSYKEGIEAIVQEIKECIESKTKIY